MLWARWSRFFLCFQFLQSPFQTFMDSSKCSNNNWYHRQPYVLCFSSYFCFLVFLVFQFVLMLLLLLFVICYCNPSFLFQRISRVFEVDESTRSSMPVSPLPPFLDTYTLSVSSLKCKAMCLVINFLVLWYMCLNSFHVHFKNIP